MIPHEARRRQAAARGCAAALLLAAFAPAPAPAAEPTGEEIARKIEARPRASHGSRVAILELHDSDGRVRERRMRSFWKLTPEAKQLVFAVQSPPELKHDAFLAIDWLDASKDDDQWIYRRSRKRAERIGNPRRGEPFLGSDFSLEDVKKEDRIERAEFTWKNLGREKLDGRSYWRLEQTPASESLARSLGWARAVSHVDPERGVRRRILRYDSEGVLLKTLELQEIRQVDGFWTATRIEATAANGHRSVFRFEALDLQSPLPDGIFSVQALERERLGSGLALPTRK